MWQTVAQPTTRASMDLHILLPQTNLFMQLAVERLLGRLIGVNATLRELPGILATDAPGPKQLTLIVGQNNAHIRAESV